MSIGNLGHSGSLQIKYFCVVLSEKAACAGPNGCGPSLCITNTSHYRKFKKTTIQTFSENLKSGCLKCAIGPAEMSNL